MLLGLSIACCLVVSACQTQSTGSSAARLPATSATSTPAHSTTTGPRATTAPPASARPTAAAVVAKPVDPCQGRVADQNVIVSIRAQHMWLCHKAQTVREFAVTTGQTDRPYRATPRGKYRIQGRNKNSVLTLRDGTQYDVKYWIPFDAPDFGFHDASWQHAGYGSADYFRGHGSHGCVHMRLADIRFFYNWVQMGTTVRVV